MPAIVEYAEVLTRLEMQRMRCVYHNSGAFAFADDVPVCTVGWIGPDDASIRAEMRAAAIQVSAPHEPTLAHLARRAWVEHLPGPVWAMPKSHWAFELSDGSRKWMPALLDEAGIRTDDLAARADAAAIEFGAGDAPSFKRFIERLLLELAVSDFALAFPNWPVLCTIHHHKQLWWQTTDEKLGNSLHSMASRD